MTNPGTGTWNKQKSINTPQWVTSQAQAQQNHFSESHEGKFASKTVE